MAFRECSSLESIVIFLTVLKALGVLRLKGVAALFDRHTGQSIPVFRVQCHTTVESGSAFSGCGCEESKYVAGTTMCNCEVGNGQCFLAPTTTSLIEEPQQHLIEEPQQHLIEELQLLHLIEEPQQHLIEELQLLHLIEEPQQRQLVVLQRSIYRSIYR